ncbi:MAG: DUF4058 family protein [Anaerolineae bacterium]|nr:DUF4058 family protein [Anaerolineae bacterium]
MSFEVINQYYGVNPHLNDELHAPTPGRSGWAQFNTSYLIDLEVVVKDQICAMGYTTSIDKGLQLREVDEMPSDKEEWRRSRRIENGDPGIESLHLLTPSSQGPVEQTVSLRELTDEKYYYALKIYRTEDRKDLNCKPVAWIELISPANARDPETSREDVGEYLSKRNSLLESGIQIVEIDFLHRNRPTIPNQPSYPNEEESSAYSIHVIDPRDMEPDLVKITTYQFNVDQPLRGVEVRLLDGCRFEPDFEGAYRKVYIEHYDDRVDYSHVPKFFDTYSPTDQDRIAARLMTIHEGLKSGAINATQRDPLPLLPGLEVSGVRHRLEVFLSEVEGS